MHLGETALLLAILVYTSSCQVVYNADDFRDKPPGGTVDAAAVDASGAIVDGGATQDASRPVDAWSPDAQADDGGGPISCDTLCTMGTCIPGNPSDVCHIDCSDQSVDCTQPIACPPGIPCLISCEDGDCLSGIDCENSGSCNITCLGNSCGGGIACGPTGCSIMCAGDGSCSGLIQCSSGFCDLGCFGAGSCGGPIDCKASCECDIQCDPGACQGTVSCPIGCDDGNGCSKYLPGCSSC